MTSDGRTYIYTTAPSILDLHSTQVLNKSIGETATGRPFRLVAVDGSKLQDQIKAYVTNMHCALSDADWKIEIQFGNVLEHAMEQSA